MSEIISRKEAKARGLPHYYTGKPCKKGHVEERLVSSWTCVECNRESSKSWYEANRDYANSVSRAWHLANRDYHNAANRAWHLVNRDHKRAYNEAWNEANPGRQRATSRARYQANPEKGKSYNRNRRARRKSAEGSHTAQDIQNIYETQQGLCAYCKVEVGTNYHVDHIQPLSKGGSNGKDNLQVTCPTCNLRKHTKTHEEFLLDNHNDAYIIVPEHD